MNQFYSKVIEALPYRLTAVCNRNRTRFIMYLFSLSFLLFFSQASNAQVTVITPSDIPSTNEGPFNKTIGGQTFTFTPASNNFVAYYNDIGTEGFGGLYSFDYNTLDGTEITLSSPAGYTFDFNSFQYISDRGAINLTVTLTFSDNTTDVHNYTLTGNSLVQTFNSFSTIANDIKSIKLVSDALIYSNNFDVTDVKPTVTLPLAWLSFTAKDQGNNIALHWKTATEINVKSFMVQHSADGHHWNNIGEIMATNTNSIQSYSFLHGTPENGRNFYRLQQQDLDSKVSYSKVLMVNFFTGNQKLNVFPNPAVNGKITIKLEKQSIVQIYNNLGILVLQKYLPAGSNSLQLTNLSKGLYSIKANNETVLEVLQ